MTRLFNVMDGWLGAIYIVALGTLSAALHMPSVHALGSGHFHLIGDALVVCTAIAYFAVGYSVRNNEWTVVTNDGETEEAPEERAAA